MTARYGRSAFKPKRRRLSDRGVFCIPKPPRLACGWGELMFFHFALCPFSVFLFLFSASFAVLSLFCFFLRFSPFSAFFVDLLPFPFFRFPFPSFCSSFFPLFSSLHLFAPSLSFFLLFLPCFYILFSVRQ